MSYGQQDLGQFNDSTVFLQPVAFRAPPVASLSRPHNNQAGSLGIYNNAKLSQHIASKHGQLIQFVTHAQHSHNTFVTSEALNLLQKYSTDEICFLVVVGDRQAGKSFFCDKVLNLAEVRGNHFCRSRSAGINIWSTPFEKEGLKVFLMEINNCDIASFEFKLLATYALMVGSAFLVIDSLEDSERSATKKLDQTLYQITRSIRASNSDSDESNYQIIMPRLFYSLQRSGSKRTVDGLKVISHTACELLPDALVRGYKGKASDLVQLPFQDTKCISQDYIYRCSQIFKDVYGKLSEKKYKDLTLNGNIVGKVLKYIEGYLNNKSELNLQTLYLQIIEDLYQSAYSYCILSYHEEMQRQFEDEAPKALEQLLEIFQQVSDSTFDKFNEFNLDERLYGYYYQKLESHIAEKEQMIMDINASKTQQAILQLYDEQQIGNVEYYKGLVGRLGRDYKHLSHGKDKILGTINAQFYTRTKGSNNIDFLIMKEIERIRGGIAEKVLQLAGLTSANEQHSKEKEKYLAAKRKVEQKASAINVQLEKTMRMSTIDAASQRKEIEQYEKNIKENERTIEELKKEGYKDKRITAAEMKIEEIGKKIEMQEKLLRELKQAQNRTEPKEGKEGKDKSKK